MNFHIMTLFPEMVMGGLNTSIIGRAMDKELISIEAVNIRDYAFNKHNKVDDYIYGIGLSSGSVVYQDGRDNNSRFFVYCGVEEH